MQGIISNYCMSRRCPSGNQMVVLVDGVKNREAATKLVGKKVVFNTGKKDIAGEVRSAHGNSGALRVLFSTGMPGQAVGKKVTINA